MTSDLLTDEGPEKLFQKRDLSNTLNGYSQDQTNTEMMQNANGALMKSKDKESALDNVNKGNIGLWSVRAMLFIFLWYFFSALTLFLNKYILSTMHGDAVLLSKLTINYLCVQNIL